MKIGALSNHTIIIKLLQCSMFNLYLMLWSYLLKLKEFVFCEFAYDAVGEISRSPQSCMHINSAFHKMVA